MYMFEKYLYFSLLCFTVTKNEKKINKLHKKKSIIHFNQVICYFNNWIKFFTKKKIKLKFSTKNLF